jgi:hypothetical protein
MAKAKSVHSTPRKTASKNRTKKRANPNRPGVIVLGGSHTASLARAKQIVDLLSTCYVREGWKIDQAAAECALAYCRAYARDASDPDEGRKAAIDFFRSHGQSLDWVFCGDIGGMICGLAKHSERAAEVAGPIEALAGKAVRS